MTCARIQRALEPDRPVPRWARSHLAECAACRVYVEDMRRLRHALAALAEVPVPEDFRHRLRARIHASAAASASAFVLWPRALALAALGGVVFAALLLGGRELQKPGDLAQRPHPPSVRSARPLVPPDGRAAAPRPSSSEISKRTRSKSDHAMTALADSGRISGTTPRAETPTSAGIPPSEITAVGVWDDPSSHDGVILLLRNEETQEESVLAIPPIVFGSRLLVPRPMPASASREELRRIL